MPRHSGAGVRSINSGNNNNNHRGGNPAAAGGQCQHQQQRPPVDNPTLDSLSSSEGDMTWEDFLATTDDDGTAAAGGRGASASAAPTGRRRGGGSGPLLGSTNNPSSPRNRLPHSLAPNHAPVNRIRVSSGSGLGLGRPSESSVSAGAAAASVMLGTVAPSSGGNVVARGGSQGSLLSSRRKEAGASYGSGLTSRGNCTSQEPEANDAESGESGGSDTESALAAPVGLCGDRSCRWSWWLLLFLVYSTWLLVCSCLHCATYRIPW